MSTDHANAAPEEPPRPAQPPDLAAEPVVHLAYAATRRRSSRAAGPPSPVLVASQTLALPLDHTTLVGELELPTQASGLVVFGHCGGSHRLNSRSRHLSRLLQQADLGVFSVDLRSPAEALVPIGPAHLPQLTQRLVAICGWLHRQPELLGLTLGLLGEANAAPAAFAAAGQPEAAVSALVALGGEAAVAAPSWSPPTVPTLLLVGEREASKVPSAGEQPTPPTGGAPSAYRLILQAGPTFQEPGALAQVGQQAAAWFTCHLARPRPVRS